MTVVDGIMDADGKSVRLVESIELAKTLVRTEKSALGKGGMNSKVEAARMVTDAGECLVVANGREDDVLLRILACNEVGTLFVPSSKKLSSRSRWIGSVRPVGTIVVDDGAAKALLDHNKSLLPAGIVKVQGEFNRGDVVAIATTTDVTIARGLTNYSASEVESIRGKKTKDVRALLAEGAYDEVIHRDNLVKA
jgi:glutamate 5-kinase